MSKETPKPNTDRSKSKLHRFYINDNERNSSEFHHKSNAVSTTKYNAFTFLPKALIFQFARPANVYFLVCAILQCIPQISPLGAETALIPVVIVLSASVLREGIEDLARAKLDKKQNNEPADFYENNTWKEVQSGKLLIGELVSVMENETFPADLILIDSELPEGICYIETGTLDGEKTLKLKESPKQTATKFNKEGEKVENFLISGEVICDLPNPELYQLNGKMHLEFNINNNNEIYDIPLDSKQLLLKGAKLKNTQWVIGIIVYTGHDCKIMKNAKEQVTKYSSVEKLMNKSLIYIFILQVILCILAAILRGIYYTKNKLNKVDNNPKSFGYTEYNYALEDVLNFCTYLLLLNTMIPISLIITLEIVKLIQGLFMRTDTNCFSHIRKKWLTPNSVSLNEECGLVNYIFTDKTGTLTCNKMEFKYCVIGNVCYQYMRGKSDENSDKDKKFRKDNNIIPFKKNQMYEACENDDKKINISTYPNFIITSVSNPKIKLSLENSKTVIENFWLGLALCHTCSIQLNEETRQLDYICVSPDSIELVKTAKNQGWCLAESGNSNIKRIILGSNENNFNDIEKLNIIEFSSDRKRETIIVKDRGIIKVYCKGADSVIEKLLSKKSREEILEQGKKFVDKFSALGFRTLFLAMRILSEEEYQKFNDDLKEAQMALEDKDEKVNKIYEQIENDLFLIGTTIVEDKLQDKVPETIHDLRLANIKIWMLTGDKMNTAYNIGLSCNLINKNMKTFYICGIELKKNEKLEIINKEQSEQVIINFAKDFAKFKGEFSSLKKPQFGILVDEKALLIINENEEIQKIFLEIAKDAVAVICCRVSPLQKSQVVKMMKKFMPNSITLAIGDGGNDVSMIMEAHIGVGIYGEEGLRAVQASDYAIGEFRILHSLLLFHGRTNYMRITECINYFFYKNFVATLCQFLYGFYCNFTGQTIIDDWFITLYNLLFTSLPLGVKALMDHDIKYDDGKIVYKLLPFIYKENRESPIFTISNFFINLLKGVIHSLLNAFWVIYIIRAEPINKSGNMAGLWFMSVNLYTNILIIVSINLMIFTKYFTWMNFIMIILITFTSYAVFLIIVESWDFFNSVGTMRVAFLSPVFWVNLLFICGTCALIDYFTLTFSFVFRPNTVTELQLLFKERGKLNSEENLPLLISEKLDIYNGEDKIINDENEEKKTEIVEKKDLSEDCLIKKDIKNDNTDVIKVINMPEKKNEENDFDFDDNYSDDFSEHMSKERRSSKNFNGVNQYFLDDELFKNQNIKFKTNFGSIKFEKQQY